MSESRFTIIHDIPHQHPLLTEKSNTSSKGLLGIAKKLTIIFSNSQQPFALLFDFSAFLGDNFKLIEIAVYALDSLTNMYLQVLHI
jgi:hypothetical protein